jgi:hypothetical protein
VGEKSVIALAFIKEILEMGDLLLCWHPYTKEVLVVVNAYHYGPAAVMMERGACSEKAVIILALISKVEGVSCENPPYTYR